MMQRMKEHELKRASTIASKHVNVQYTLGAKAHCVRCKVLCSGDAAAVVGCHMQSVVFKRCCCCCRVLTSTSWQAQLSH